MKKIATAIAFVALFISTAFADVSPKHIETNVKKLVKEFTETHQDLNATYEFKQKNKVITKGASGYFSVEKQTKLQPDQEMLIASGTKNVIAAAILKLEEAGKLKVNDTLAMHFPQSSAAWTIANGKSFTMPQWFNDITIHNLLTHTSGIREYIFNTKIDPTKTHEEINRHILQFAASTPPEFVPGAKYDYCNTGYVLLGMIIENLSGVSLPEHLNNTFFKPLGMQNTHMATLQEVVDYRHGRINKYPELYFAHYKDGKFTTKHAETHFFFVPYADGGIITTVDDFTNWHYKLHNGKIINKASYKKMTTPHVDAPIEWDAKRKAGYGIFITNMDDKHTVYYHSGKAAGIRSESGYVPSLKLSFTILSNVMPMMNDKIDITKTENQLDIFFLLDHVLKNVTK